MTLSEMTRTVRPVRNAVVLSSDPWARIDRVRVVVPKSSCTFCGRTQARFAYGVQCSDNLRGDVAILKGTFCNKGCRDAYYGID